MYKFYMSFERGMSELWDNIKQQETKYIYILKIVAVIT